MDTCTINNATLKNIFASNQGDPSVRIAIIDGAVDSSHPDFNHTNIKKIGTNEPSQCSVKNSPSCQHGTFVAGVLGASRSSKAPGICPQCTFIAKPIFCEASNLSQCPTVTEETLALAIHESINEGAKIINMSIGLSSPRGEPVAQLYEAYDRAQQAGVLLVGASGNQSASEVNSIFKHPWVIPVAAMDERGNIEPQSNRGAWVAEHGLLASGSNVTSTAAGGGYQKMTGTSVATPFVSGVLALLWSQYPNASAETLRNAILQREPTDLAPDSLLPASLLTEGISPDSSLPERSLSESRARASPEIPQVLSPERSLAILALLVEQTPSIFKPKKEQPIMTPAIQGPQTQASCEAVTANPDPVAQLNLAEAPNKDVTQNFLPQQNPVGIEPQACPSCGGDEGFDDAGMEEFIYVSGTLRPHFTSLGLEKENESAAQLLGVSPRQYYTIFTYKDEQGHQPYRYIAEQVSWILSIDKQDTYVLIANSSDELNEFIDTLSVAEKGSPIDESIVVAVGYFGPEAPMSLSDNKPLHMVRCNHLFSFTPAQMLEELSGNQTSTRSIRDVLTALNLKPNIGRSDSERAENFVAYRYSALYVKSIDLTATPCQPPEVEQFLENLETKNSNSTPGRRVVDIILTYQETVGGRQTSYFMGVDVTDEFPFLHSNITLYIPSN